MADAADQVWERGNNLLCVLLRAHKMFNTKNASFSFLNTIKELNLVPSFQRLVTLFLYIIQFDTFTHTIRKTNKAKTFYLNDYIYFT